MPKLLAVLASPRGDYSVSTSLTHTFIDAWKKSHSGGEVVVRDLNQTEMPFVDLPWIGGAYTPAEQHSPEMAKAIKVSNDLIAELQAADHIVIGTPMYNFAIPAILKAWIDHVVRVGVTVSASYEGQLKGKKATAIIASGGLYTPGAPAEGYNQESSYLKSVLGFIGLTDLKIVLAGGSSGVQPQGSVSFPDHLAKYTAEVEAAAS